MRILTFFLLLANALVGQTSASAALDRNTVETGDTFTLRVLVSGLRAEPGKIDFSAWRGLLPPDNVLSQSPWARSGERWVRACTLIAFDSASLQLPPLTVRLPRNDSVRTNPLQLTVRPTRAPDEVAEAERIRDIRREPTLWTDYWPWALGGLVVILLLWRAFRRKPAPRPTFVAPPPPPAPAHEAALRQLADLEKQKPWEKGEVLPFYVSLSLILREYLEKRFGIPALESTTREILPMLKNGELTETMREALREILESADVAKYADWPPEGHFHQKNLASARRLVEATATK